MAAHGFLTLVIFSFKISFAGDLSLYMHAMEN